MVKNNLLGFSAVLSVIVFILHFLGIYFFWYVEYWWLDVVTHLIGGLWVGVTLIWLVYFSGYLNINQQTYGSSRYFKVSLWGTLLSAIGWELFEYLLDVGLYEGNYWTDTGIDISMGLLGALFAAIVAKKWIKA